MEQAQKIVFFDGGCLLCSSVVQWTHRRDRAGEIWFAALESEFAARHRDELALPPPGDEADTFVFWNRSEGQVSVKSAGALALLKALGGFWAILGMMGSLLPILFRDGVYDWVARNRRKWFGTSEDCPLPPASLRGKVLA